MRLLIKVWRMVIRMQFLPICIIGWLSFEGPLVTAQPIPIRWNQVPAGELVKFRDTDESSSGALVLCDYGTVDYEDVQGVYQLVYFRHTRIKVLNKNGLRFANIRILYRPAWKEAMVDLKAQSISLNQDGSIERQSLVRSNVLDEKVNEEFSAKVFTIPGVMENSVFEYSYKLISNDLYNYRSWQFQKQLPVIWSEYRAELAGLYNYQVALHNISNPLYINEKYDTIAQVPSFLVTSRQGPEMLHVKKTMGRWVMQDIPALVSEPFVSAPSDNIMEIKFQLYAVNLPGEKPLHFIQNWNDIARILNEDIKFGKQIKSDRIYKQIVGEILNANETEEIKIKKLHSWMVNNVSWDGKTAFRSSKEVSQMATDLTGNSADVNLFLLNLLKEAGIDAFPVLLSTTWNGKVQKEIPLLSQFNKSIIEVRYGGKEQLIDLTNPMLLPGVLPPEDLSSCGLLLINDQAIWIPIDAGMISKSTSIITFRFKTDGSMTGYYVLKEKGYKAFESMEAIHRFGIEDYTRQVLDGINTGLTIDSSKFIPPASSTDVFYLELNFSSDEWLDQFKDKDYIYFDAQMSGGSNENYFLEDSRTQPIEFPYPFETVSTMVIEIPEGYAIEEVPNNERLSLEKGDMDYSFNVSHNEEVVQVQSRLVVREKIFPARDYKAIKELFGVLASKYNEHIIAGKEDEE
jgi:hypothetical protein